MLQKPLAGMRILVRFFSVVEFVAAKYILVKDPFDSSFH